MNKHVTAVVMSVVSATVAPSAFALGFGRIVPSATLGQVLQVTVPIRVSANERFGADCLQVDVLFGETRLTPNQIRTSVEAGAMEGEWLVHVTTTSPIEEPVVEIGMSAGCERRFTRRFTAFADPPAMRLAAVASGQAPVAGLASVAQSQALAPVASADGVNLLASPGRSGKSGNGHGRASRHAAAKASGGGASAPTPALARGPVKALADAGARPGATGAAPVRGASRLVLDGGYARLKMDMDDPVIMPMRPMAAGASAATLALAYDDPDAARAAEIERSVQALRKESQAHRAATEQIKSRLATAESRNEWLPWLLALLGLSAGAVGVLGWKLRQQQRLARHWYQEPVSAVAPLDAVPSQAPLPAPQAPHAPQTRAPAGSEGPVSIVGRLVDAGPDSEPPPLPLEPMAATAPLSRAALAALPAEPAAAARELSVEELLDLEQQADFFIALGQDDAAVDLLMSHLRSVGGQSPLPYTKLLEIYRRQGDRAAYERTRARFNRRFNAYAPDWDTGPGTGRSLEDYVDTLSLVQRAWVSPIDAMAILEAMLFKRDDTSELFDLPAYRDILLLYSLARDLWHQSGSAATATHVDVLLPLEDLGEDAPLSVVEFASVDHPVSASPEGLPAIDHGGLPDVHGDHVVEFELTGFELLGADQGHDGVRATLDAEHLGGRARGTDALPEIEHLDLERRP